MLVPFRVMGIHHHLVFIGKHNGCGRLCPQLVLIVPEGLVIPFHTTCPGGLSATEAMVCERQIEKLLDIEYL